MTTKTNTHNKAVEFAARNLIENDISTKKTNESGADLELNNGKTVLVRGMNEETRAALTMKAVENLEADYIIIATNLKYTSIKNIYILPTEKAMEIAINCPLKSTGGIDFFIDRAEYSNYKDNYDIMR